MSAPSLSIVMTYFERFRQLMNTLYSFKWHGYGKDVEVVVVDDGSCAEPAAPPSFSFDFSLRILRIPPEEKWYKNACVPFNHGFQAAIGQVGLFQNAECLHYTNVVRHALEHVTDENYLSYACYSLDGAATSSLAQEMTTESFWREFPFSTEKPTGDGANGWYNHSQINPVGYHFCAGITSENLRRLGGFDERYARGVAFDDNEMLHRIKGLPLEVKIVDEAIVLHQFHYTRELLELRSGDHYERNKLLYKYYTLGGRTSFGYFQFWLMFNIFSRRKFRRFLSKAKRRLLGKLLAR